MIHTVVLTMIHTLIHMVILMLIHMEDMEDQDMVIHMLYLIKSLKLDILKFQE